MVRTGKKKISVCYTTFLLYKLPLFENFINDPTVKMRSIILVPLLQYCHYNIVFQTVAYHITLFLSINRRLKKEASKGGLKKQNQKKPPKTQEVP